MVNHFFKKYQLFIIMKKIILLSLFILIIIISNAFATIKTVTVQSYIFTPTPLNAFIGDTVKWTWINGTHTTTSLNVPTGALSWNNPIDASNTSFIYAITTAGTYNYQCNFHGQIFGMTGVINAQAVGIKQIETVVPKYELKQNYPNPFNPTTIINFNIPQKSLVTLKLYDISGREIGTLVNSELNSGGYSVDFNGEKYASGIYIYKLQADNFTDVKKMTLIK
jgi:plastocyanin